MEPNTITAVRQRFDVIDLARVILAIMVVCIHAQVFPGILLPYLRLSVPVFFMISSFFFFQKMNSITNEKEQRLCLKKYVVRNLKLYLFYFLLLLPITYIKRNWFRDGIISGIADLLKSLLFGSTFVASWFIMASVIGVVIVFFLSKKMKLSILLAITGVIYLECCMASNYEAFFHQLPYIKQIMDFVEALFGASYNSFLVSLIWILLGKAFADRKIKLNIKISWFMLALSLILLTLENYCIKKYNLAGANDCYIMLIPTSIAIFSLLLKTQAIQLNHTAEFRKISVMIYAVHGSIIPVLKEVLERIHFPSHPLILLVVTLGLCLVYCILVLKLEKISALKWLKYAY